MLVTQPSLKERTQPLDAMDNYNDEDGVDDHKHVEGHQILFSLFFIISSLTLGHLNRCRQSDESENPLSTFNVRRELLDFLFLW